MAGLLFEQEHLAGAKCLHAVSEGEVNGIRRYGLRNAICVVPVGVDLPQLENMKPASPWEGIIDSGRKVLLYLGRLHPVKGLRHLLLAISRAVSDNPQLASNWAIAIAGWGENDYENELRELVRDLGVEESVKFLGPLYDEKKSAAYAHAHAFVLPSHSEGLPVTVLEAWAHGLPVLMTAACNLHEGFSAGAAVEITPTPEGVFAGLKEIFSMAGPELLEMGSRGRQLVEQRFAWAKCAREMYKVYDWLLGGSARPDCVLPKQ